MKIKTSELTDRALDWAVELSLGGTWRPYIKYSTDWAQGGPIIEREWVDLTPWPNESDEDLRWQAVQFDAPEAIEAFGPTPLIAAMRCFVASKLGADVNIPEELA